MGPQPGAVFSQPKKFRKNPLLTLITGSTDVTDVGIQNLVFPLSIQKAGRVNLVNTRARTNPPAKQLHTVIAKETGVDTTGVR